VLHVDAVVLGAGPAGATVALNLAPFWRVLVIEKRACPGLRIGESLPAAGAHGIGPTSAHGKGPGKCA